MKTTSTNSLVKIGCGAALVVATLLAPFASSEPDGLDRVAADLKFEQKSDPSPVAQQLPFFQVFDEYQLKVIADAKIATALAGLIGTVTTFGLTWAIAKSMVKSPSEKDL